MCRMLAINHNGHQSARVPRGVQVASRGEKHGIGGPPLEQPQNLNHIFKTIQKSSKQCKKEYHL